MGLIRNATIDPVRGETYAVRCVINYIKPPKYLVTEFNYMTRTQCT